MGVTATSSNISASVSGSQISASLSGQGLSVGFSSSGSVGVQSGAGLSSAPVLSVNGQVGHVFVPTQVQFPRSPPGYAVMSSVFGPGSFSISARSSTGYVAIQWWDGLVQVFGNGSSSVYHSMTRTVNPTSSWARSSPKQISVWSCAPAASSRSGDLTGLSCPSRSLFALSVSGCSMLTDLSCESNELLSLDVSGCVSLARLTCFSNRLGSLDVSDSTAMTELYCQLNLLAGIDVSQQVSLVNLQCNSNPISSLYLANNQELFGLYCHSCDLASLDLRSNTKLRNVNASGNRLSSVFAAGLALSGTQGGNFSDNLLSASSLNAIYGDLLPVSSGSLYVGGNPGSASDTPSIATSKGYAVYGT